MVETPRESAEQRVKELTELLARLRAGDIPTEHDVSEAFMRASEARRRAVLAHLRTAERLLHAARVHEQAAKTFDRWDAARPASDGANVRASDNSAAASRNRMLAESEVRRAIEIVRQMDSDD